MRAIIFSDAHGEPDVIHAVIDHSGFVPERDRLIFAGDAIEVGRDSAAALRLLEELGAEFLVGNHEYAVYVDRQLEAELLDASVEATVLDRVDRGVWNLAAEVDDVLITHAGVSSFFADEFEGAPACGSVTEFVRGLNRAFRETIASRSPLADGVCDADGPLWFRPGDGAAPLRGVVQIAGHTPVALLRGEGDAERLAGQGLYLIDPHVRRWRSHGYAPPVPLRYAVIEDGAVRVISE